VKRFARVVVVFSLRSFVSVGWVYICQIERWSRCAIRPDDRAQVSGSLADVMACEKDAEKGSEGFRRGNVCWRDMSPEDDLGPIQMGVSKEK